VFLPPTHPWLSRPDGTLREFLVLRADGAKATLTSMAVHEIGHNGELAPGGVSFEGRFKKPGCGRDYAAIVLADVRDPGGWMAPRSPGEFGIDDVVNEDAHGGREGPRAPPDRPVSTPRARACAHCVRPNTSVASRPGSTGAEYAVPQGQNSSRQGQSSRPAHGPAPPDPPAVALESKSIERGSEGLPVGRRSGDAKGRGYPLPLFTRDGSHLLFQPPPRPTSGVSAETPRNTTQWAAMTMPFPRSDDPRRSSSLAGKGAAALSQRSFERRASNEFPSPPHPTGSPASIDGLCEAVAQVEQQSQFGLPFPREVPVWSSRPGVAPASGSQQAASAPDGWLLSQMQLRRFCPGLDPPSKPHASSDTRPHRTSPEHDDADGLEIAEQEAGRALESLSSGDMLHASPPTVGPEGSRASKKRRSSSGEAPGQASPRKEPRRGPDVAGLQVVQAIAPPRGTPIPLLPPRPPAGPRGGLPGGALHIHQAPAGGHMLAPAHPSLLAPRPCTLLDSLSDLMLRVRTFNEIYGMDVGFGFGLGDPGGALCSHYHHGRGHGPPGRAAPLPGPGPAPPPGGRGAPPGGTGVPEGPWGPEAPSAGGAARHDHPGFGGRHFGGRAL